MKVNETTEYVLTKPEVMAACIEYIKKGGVMLPEGVRSLSIINEVVEPPPGFSDMGITDYEFKGIKVMVK
ncbi:MAG: hypothetical protein KAS32_05680 [Candidatus Peribacteraceae bacterium]|nr:hypothetical protein [Candidatus Peribacteraceae bacterium]